MPMKGFATVFHAHVAMRLRGVFYGWWMVGLTGFLLALMSVTGFQGLGTFLVALERQFGWSRFAMSGAFALGRVEGAIIGPIEGYLIDHLGSRRMVFIGFIIIGIGFLLFSQVDSLWQFYLAFLVITVGAGLGGWLAGVTVVNNWFQRRRSLALAVSQAGGLLAGFLVPVLALGIEAHGFRWVTMGIGIFLLAIVGRRPGRSATGPKTMACTAMASPAPGLGRIRPSRGRRSRIHRVSSGPHVGLLDDHGGAHVYHHLNHRPLPAPGAKADRYVDVSQ